MDASTSVWHLLFNLLRSAHLSFFCTAVTFLTPTSALVGTVNLHILVPKHLIPQHEHQRWMRSTSWDNQSSSQRFSAERKRV